MFGLWGIPPFVTCFKNAFPRGNCLLKIASWKYFERKDTFLKQPFKAKAGYGNKLYTLFSFNMPDRFWAGGMDWTCLNHKPRFQEVVY